MIQEEPGRAVFVVANKRRVEAIRSSWEAWWPATTLYVEGACVGELVQPATLVEVAGVP